MITLTAKKYSTNFVPLLGEYALYRDGDTCYFVIGDGETPVERLVTKKSYPVFVIPENVFNSMNRLSEKYPVNGGPYKCEELDVYDLHDIDVINDFMYETIEEDA